MTYVGFPKSAFNLVLCPKDGGQLISNNHDEFVLVGDLRCEKCGSSYKISDGIIRFDELIDDKLMQQEIKSRNYEAVKYDQRLSPRFLREIVPTLKLIGKTLGKIILEYGAGTGRLTSELEGASLVLAVDFSFDSLKVLASKDSLSPLALICADATKLQLKEGAFDVIVATQLIEHIPTIELRYTFYQLVKNHLATGGFFLASVYHHDLRRRSRALPLEGEHKGGIFYHYFMARDWRRELSAAFSNITIGYLDLTWPLLARLKLPVKVSGLLSWVGVSLPLIRQLAHLLWVKAQ